MCGDLMLLGDILSELRKDKSLKQKDLADMLNVSINTISDYENNRYSPDYENLAKIADIFNVSIDFLLGRIRKNVDLKWLLKEFGKLNGIDVTMIDVLFQLEKLSPDSKKLMLELFSMFELKDKYDKK
jgi:transcriptional regulator with XRE-family HTH domain